MQYMFDLIYASLSVYVVVCAMLCIFYWCISSAG